MDTERKAACACAAHPKKGNQIRENRGRAHAKSKTEKEPKERPRGKAEADQERHRETQRERERDRGKEKGRQRERERETEKERERQKSIRTEKERDAGVAQTGGARRRRFQQLAGCRPGRRSRRRRTGPPRHVPGHVACRLAAGALGVRAWGALQRHLKEAAGAVSRTAARHLDAVGGVAERDLAARTQRCTVSGQPEPGADGPNAKKGTGPWPR